MNRVKMALALAVTLVAARAFAAPSLGAVRLSTTQVKLGAPFTVEVQVADPRPEAWHALAPPPGSPFSILGTTQRHDAGGDAVQIELGLYALGASALPELHLQSEHGEELTLPSAGTVTAVSTLAKGDAALHGLAGPRVPQVMLWPRVIAAALGGFALVAMTWLALRFARRTWLSEERRDRRTLERLLGGAADDVAFYVALDALVRRHLRRRHGIPAGERTSAELAAALETHPELPSNDLRALFHQADLVKFAGRPAEHGRRDADAQLARQLLAKPLRHPRGDHAASALS